MQVLPRAARWEEFAHTVVENLQRHAVTPAHHEPRERGGKIRRKLQLRHAGSAGKSHAAAAVHEQMALEIRLLLEGLHEVPIAAREDAPVHERRRIARRVGAVFVKLRRRPAQPRAMPPGQPALRKQPRRELKMLS